MWKRSVLSLGVLLSACGTTTGGAPVDTDVDGTATADIAGTDATASDLVDVAGTDAIDDTAGTDALADSGQCLPLFTACKMGDTCCPPYQCMNMGNGLQCQGEGPDIQQPDIVQDTAPDAAPDIATIDIGVSCSGTSSNTFPNFEAWAKDCKVDSDCFAAFHQINCCGTHIAFGLNKSAKTAFQYDESICAGQYPACGCAQFMTEAEDGYSSFTYSDFAATCDAGLCRTHVLNAKPTCTPQGLQEPKPVKSCTSVADCDFSMETLDCCGSQEFVGIAKFAKKGFDAEEQKCAMSIAVCDCMPKPTTLEDGKTLTTNAVPLACVNGACMTGTP